MNEYIVTVHRKEDLEGFYHDMETLGGPFHIPDRRVECCKKRPISRNTHYWLTDEEAQEIEKDPRVKTVSRTIKDMGLEVRPLFEQTSTQWTRNGVNNAGHRNWGLLRCFEGQQRSGWGVDGVAAASGTVNIPGEGRNVDVVIVDGHFFPDHPEFSGRFVPFNWFSLNPQVNPGDSRDEYSYAVNGPGAEGDDNHGCHVAGTAVGSLQGWARSANIYCLNLYSTNVNGNIDNEVLFDYIREFHRTKPVNPQTGRKNPTIVNNSWGLAGTLPVSAITSVEFRGQTFNGPFTETQLIEDYGIMAGVQQSDTVVFQGRSPALDEDLLDARDEGIIMVGAAGNESYLVDQSGGPDYDNRLFVDSQFAYYHRGSSPGASEGSICVGAIGPTVNEAKAEFSNCGPRVDIYAPGVWIISSLNTGGTTDSRDSQFRTGKLSGTSMASPQVTGLLACALETNPRWTPQQALDYLIATAGVDQITDTEGSFDDFTSLQGSANRYLRFRTERPSSGATFPRTTTFLRPVGASPAPAFPRTRIRRSR